MTSKLIDFTPDQHTAILNKINQMFLSGVARLTIRELIKSYSPIDDLSNTDVDELLSQASILLESTTPLDRNQIMLVHISHYEKIYSYFDSIHHTEGKNKALRVKEKLLGMVTGPKLTLNNTMSVNLRPKPEYDEKRLTPAQKERYDILLEKIRIPV